MTSFLYAKEKINIIIFVDKSYFTQIEKYLVLKFFLFYLPFINSIYLNELFLRSLLRELYVIFNFLCSDRCNI